MNGDDIVRRTAARLHDTYGELKVPYAERLLEHVLQCTRSELYLRRKHLPDEDRLREIDRIVERCRAREPLDYILGTSFFYTREFEVSPAVLLPRPDTEVLVEQVLAGEEEEQLLFADIGTGSGIIVAVLTEERIRWRGVGIDCSEAALKVARRNVRSERVGLLCADIFSALKKGLLFDFIVSNPPYIPTITMKTLDRSVRDFEPCGALDGGSDGLDFYRWIANDAPSYLKPGGRVYCEIGFDQEFVIRDIFSVAPWNKFHCTCDLAGHPRVISCRLG
ncbi:MAG: peptide chain release factor N(5)-glutamine methyltransferase [Chitinispirillaceae bacterium]|nr:peptide chain release factor N(5)-glutamine methyltransferase [Chitinispirillaceae bacterium]